MQSKGTGPKGPKVDVYQDVTDRIIAQLEAGTIPWRKPWRCVDGTTPRNLVSGKPYRGINLLLLSMTPYASPYWVTFKQAQSKGGRVRKGEKSTLVVFWRMLKVEDAAAPKGFKTIPMLRHYRIFNVEQCDGIDVPEPAELPDFDPIDECEAIWSGFEGKRPVSFGGDSACYMPQLDAMRMPVREGFASPQAFYLTLFHESIHSTGHPSRLGRFAETDGPQAFGSESYAKEELVAEMGSAMLGTVAGIDPSAWLPQSAAYIASWLKSLRNDPKMVVGAAGKAQRAAEHILGTSDDGSDHEDVQPVKPSSEGPGSGSMMVTGLDGPKGRTARADIGSEALDMLREMGASVMPVWPDTGIVYGPERQTVPVAPAVRIVPKVYAAQGVERLCHVVEISAMGVMVDDLLSAERVMVTRDCLRSMTSDERRHYRATGELADVRPVHFTMTGQYAGQPFCDAPRDDRSTFCHVPCVDETRLSEDFRLRLCPLCRDIAYGTPAQVDAATAEVERRLSPEPVAKPAPAPAKGKRAKVKSMGVFASMLAVPEGQLQAWRNLMGRDPGLDVPVGLSVEYRGRSMRFDSGSVPFKTLKLALS